MNNEPASISGCDSDEQQQQVDVDMIIQKSKLEQSQQASTIKPTLSLQSQTHQANANSLEEQKQLDEIELQMLVEECQQLIAKISPNINNFYIQDEASMISQAQQSFSMKREKNRLEKQYIELCLEIQRQQKQLQNFRFKVQVAQKEAQYYSRQIKQKSAILQNLQQHCSKKGRQSFRK